MIALYRPKDTPGLTGPSALLRLPPPYVGQDTPRPLREANRRHVRSIFRTNAKCPDRSRAEGPDGDKPYQLVL